MQAHGHAHAVQLPDTLLLRFPDELPVEVRTHERRGGISHADVVRPRLDLRAGERELHFHDERDQVPDKGWGVKEVHQEPAETTQVAGLGHWPFDPALDGLFGAAFLLQASHDIDALSHPRCGPRIGDLQGDEPSRVQEERIGVIDGRRRIIPVDDRRAQVGGLDSGIRYAGDVIESVGTADGRLAPGVGNSVHRVDFVGDSDLVRCLHHRDCHVRQGVHRLAAHGANHPLFSGHAASMPPAAADCKRMLRPASVHG